MKIFLLRAAFKTACSGLFVWLVFPALLCSAELQVGTALVDITPNKAVALWGQFGRPTEQRHRPRRRTDAGRQDR